jgi:hypothetical protein
MELKMHLINSGSIKGDLGKVVIIGLSGELIGMLIILA